MIVILDLKKCQPEEKSQIHRLNQNRAQANHFGGFLQPVMVDELGV